MYDTTAKAIEAAIRPEHAALSPDGRKALAFFLTLACNYGAGDALAGSLLKHLPTQKVMTTLETLGLKLKPVRLSPMMWAINYFDQIADFLLTVEMAKRIKTASLSGRGFYVGEPSCHST